MPPWAGGASSVSRPLLLQLHYEAILEPQQQLSKALWHLLECTNSENVEGHSQP